MPEEGVPKKKRAVKRVAAKTSAPRKRAAKKAATAPPPASPEVAGGDRLTDVARTIGSTVGGIVKKTKKVLRREKT